MFQECYSGAFIISLENIFKVCGHWKLSKFGENLWNISN